MCHRLWSQQSLLSTSARMLWVSHLVAPTRAPYLLLLIILLSILFSLSQKTGKLREESKVITIFLGLNRLQTHIINCNKTMLERNWIFWCRVLEWASKSCVLQLKDQHNFGLKTLTLLWTAAAVMTSLVWHRFLSPSPWLYSEVALSAHWRYIWLNSSGEENQATNIICLTLSDRKELLVWIPLG